MKNKEQHSHTLPQNGLQLATGTFRFLISGRDSSSSWVSFRALGSKSGLDQYGCELEEGVHAGCQYLVRNVDQHVQCSTQTEKNRNAQILHSLYTL